MKKEIMINISWSINSKIIISTITGVFRKKKYIYTQITVFLSNPIEIEVNLA